MSDWFTQNAPSATPGPPPPPPAATPPPSPTVPPAGGGWFMQNAPTVQPSLTDNPNGEGIYRMKGPDGRELGIPYSKAKNLGVPQGYSFADNNERNRFLKDYVRDPELNRSLVELAGQNPMLNHFIGAAKYALHTVFGIGDVLSGSDEERQKQAEAAGLPSQQGQPSAIRQFANEPGQNWMQTVGGMGESAGELALGGEALKGEQLLKLLPELQGSKALETATKLGKIAEAHPMVAHALTNAGVQGAQTYVRTGGDVEAAVRDAAIAGGASLATAGVVKGAGKVMEGVQTGAAARQAENEAVQAAETAKAEYPGKKAQAEAAARAGVEQGEQTRQAAAVRQYGATARQTIEPHLEAVRAAGEPPTVMMAQPGGAPAVATRGANITGINVDESLNRVGDFTAARTELQNSLNKASDAMDTATGGRFRALNREVSDAQSKVWASNGHPDAVAAYDQKRAELNDLFNQSRGQVRPELTDAMRGAWSHYYLLGDITNGLDKAVRGLPGETAVSQVQRGIKGDVLTRELEGMIRKNGRGAVEQALGGADRLNTLYQIGEETSTNAGRRRLNQALVNVARYLPEPTPHVSPGKPAGSKLVTLVPEAFGTAVGWHFGGFIGARVGQQVAKEATETAVGTVQKAVMANPKIAKQLIYAAKQGADPAKYGPIIAALISGSRQNDIQEEQ